MPISYYPGDEDTYPYYESLGPSILEMDEMVNSVSKRDFYNFVVSGRPKRVSPEWIARHPGYEEGNYDYAVSYAIYAPDLDVMIGDAEDVTEAFNIYLEGTGKEWIDVESIKLVDKRDPWEDTY